MNLRYKAKLLYCTILSLFLKHCDSIHAKNAFNREVFHEEKDPLCISYTVSGPKIKEIYNKICLKYI